MIAMNVGMGLVFVLNMFVRPLFGDTLFCTIIGLVNLSGLYCVFLLSNKEKAATYKFVPLLEKSSKEITELSSAEVKTLNA